MRLWEHLLRIVLITPVQILDGFPEYNLGSDKTLINDATREIADYYSLPIINADKESMINRQTQSAMLIDYVHHSDYGGVRFAEMVIGKFEDLPYIAE